MKRRLHPQRGDIYWVRLDPVIGTEIAKTRPAVIISNDVGNEVSDRVIVAPVTSKRRVIFPFEVALDLDGKEGKILLDQIRSIDKVRLAKKIGSCDQEIIDQIDEALKLVLSLS